MKYRFISFKRTTPPIKQKRSFRLKGRNTLRVYSPPIAKPIGITELFAFGHLYDPNLTDGRPSLSKRILRASDRAFISLYKKVSHLRALWTKLLNDIKKAISVRRERIRKRKERRARLPSLLPCLCGALCAALTVALFSAGFVIYKLILENYFGTYKTVYVPEFVGQAYPPDTSVSELDYCNITVKYEYDQNIPEGVVISQTPSANVCRRVYKNKSLCNISLTVSLGKKNFTMNDYSSLSLRDAVLELKNESIRFSIQQSHSDSVEAGKILYTSPSVGEIFSYDETVIITVSLGPEKIYVTTPNLYGLTESRAIGALRAAGLEIGEITYIRSERPQGTVISQGHTAYSSIEKGSSVSFSVSAGIGFNEKTVPDLYGMSIEEARQRLAEVGLVCGHIYAVANGAPSGTVITQSLLPGTPITAGTVSIDIYVSS